MIRRVGGVLPHRQVHACLVAVLSVDSIIQERPQASVTGGNRYFSMPAPALCPPRRRASPSRFGRLGRCVSAVSLRLSYRSPRRQLPCCYRRPHRRSRALLPCHAPVVCPLPACVGSRHRSTFDQRRRSLRHMPLCPSRGSYVSQLCLIGE